MSRAVISTFADFSATIRLGRGSEKEESLCLGVPLPPWMLLCLGWQRNTQTTNFRTTVRSAALDLAKLSGMSFSLSWESQDLLGAVNDDLAIKYAAWSV